MGHYFKISVKLMAFSLLALLIIALPGFIGSESKAAEIFNSKTTDFNDWYTKWGDGPVEAVIINKNNKIIVMGQHKKQSFGAVHKSITMIIKDDSYLEIEVESVSDSWYLIISGKKIQNGYVQIEKDAKKIGKFKYNLKNKLKISGKVTFDIQIGVSDTKEYKSCFNKTVVLKSLKLFGKIENRKKTDKVDAYDLINDKNNMFIYK